MRTLRFNRILGCATALFLAIPSVSSSQVEPQGEETKKPFKHAPLFTSEAPIEITLVAPFHRIKRQKVGERPYHTASIVYSEEGRELSVPVRVRARGIWRRKNCEIPPLMLNFAKDSVKGTAFARLDKVRLVQHCRNNDTFEQYVLKEVQLYRAQRLITPLSLDVRLARVTYVDSEKRDTLARRYGALLEHDETLAERLGAELVEIQGASPRDLHQEESAIFGVFQYMIGNTDFSVRGLHNVSLLRMDTAYVPVAYDYDWTGAVNARYAKPNEILQIRTVTQRLMRGYCTSPENYEKAFAVFRDKKDVIYALYSDSVVGSAMDPKVVSWTLKYFDEFYETIEDPRRARRDIVEACLGGAA